MEEPQALVSIDLDAGRLSVDAACLNVLRSAHAPVVLFGIQPSQQQQHASPLWLHGELDLAACKRLCLMHLQYPAGGSSSSHAGTRKLLRCALSCSSTLVVFSGPACTSMSSSTLTEQLKLVAGALSELQRPHDGLAPLRLVVLIKPSGRLAHQTSGMASQAALTAATSMPAYAPGPGEGKEDPEALFERQQLHLLPEALLCELQTHAEMHVVALAPENPKAGPEAVAGDGGGGQPELAALLEPALRRLGSLLGQAAEHPGAMPPHLMLNAFVRGCNAGGAASSCSYAGCRAAAEEAFIEEAADEAFQAYRATMLAVRPPATLVSTHKSAKAAACMEFLKTVNRISDADATTESYRSLKARCDEALPQLVQTAALKKPKTRHTLQGISKAVLSTQRLLRMFGSSHASSSSAAAESAADAVPLPGTWAPRSSLCPASSTLRGSRTDVLLANLNPLKKNSIVETKQAKDDAVSAGTNVEPSCINNSNGAPPLVRTSSINRSLPAPPLSKAPSTQLLALTALSADGSETGAAPAAAQALARSGDKATASGSGKVAADAGAVAGSPTAAAGPGSLKQRYSMYGGSSLPSLNVGGRYSSSGAQLPGGGEDEERALTYMIDRTKLDSGTLMLISQQHIGSSKALPIARAQSTLQEKDLSPLTWAASPKPFKLPAPEANGSRKSSLPAVSSPASAFLTRYSAYTSSADLDSLPEASLVRSSAGELGYVMERHRSGPVPSVASLQKQTSQKQGKSGTGSGAAMDPLPSRAAAAAAGGQPPLPLAKVGSNRLVDGFGRLGSMLRRWDQHGLKN